MAQPDDPARTVRPRYLEEPSYCALNTVRALKCLAFAKLSTAELADIIQLSPRTARRVVQRLMREGFVAQERRRGGHYYATLRLAVLRRQMLDHAPFAQAATPRLVQLAHGTRCMAQLWVRGYDEQIVCAVCADRRADSPAVSALGDVVPAPLSAAGTVLRGDQWSSCYVQHATGPTFAAAVVDSGQVVAALGVTGEPQSRYISTADASRGLPDQSERVPSADAPSSPDVFPPSRQRGSHPAAYETRLARQARMPRTAVLILPCQRLSVLEACAPGSTLRSSDPQLDPPHGGRAKPLTSAVSASCQSRCACVGSQLPRNSRAASPSHRA